MAENMRIVVPAPEAHKQHKPLCTDLLTGYAASKGVHLCKMCTTPKTLADTLIPKKMATILGADAKSFSDFQVYPFKTFGDLLRFTRGADSKPDWEINHIPGRKESGA